MPFRIHHIKNLHRCICQTLLRAINDPRDVTLHIYINMLGPRTRQFTQGSISMSLAMHHVHYLLQCMFMPCRYSIHLCCVPRGNTLFIADYQVLFYCIQKVETIH